MSRIAAYIRWQLIDGKDKARHALDCAESWIDRLGRDAQADSEDQEVFERAKAEIVRAKEGLL